MPELTKAQRAARFAKEQHATLERAAIRFGCTTAEASRAWQSMFPTEPRRAVP